MKQFSFEYAFLFYHPNFLKRSPMAHVCLQIVYIQSSNCTSQKPAKTHFVFTEESCGSVLCISHLGDFILKHCKPVEPLLPHGSARPVCSRWHQTGSQAEHTHRGICTSPLGDPGESLVIWTLAATLKTCGSLYQTLEETGDTRFQSRWADTGTELVQEGQPVLPGLQSTTSLDISVGEEIDIYYSILEKQA